MPPPSPSRVQPLRKLSVLSFGNISSRIAETMSELISPEQARNRGTQSECLASGPDLRNNALPICEVSEDQDGAVVETDIPARLDALRWGRFHTLVVAALGITWILDGLEVTLTGALAGILK
jgi:hypothetical protein